MGKKRKKQLNLSVRFAWIFSLYLVCLSILAFVYWAERTPDRRFLGFLDPAVVRFLVFTAMPLLLVVVAVIFLWRAGPVIKLRFVHRMLYNAIAFLTGLATIVLLFFGWLSFANLWRN